MKKTEDTSRKKSLIFLHHDFKLWHAFIITVIVMSALICFVYFCNIPNPNMILIAGLVVCSAFFGFAGGVPAAIIMLGYTLYFFSAGQKDGQFMVFVGNNLSKVFVSIFGIVVDMLFVCLLKKNESAEYHNVEELTKELRAENERLIAQSRIDALTGIGNRLALRDRFDSYLSHNLSVIMIDVDNFKLINDNYGHIKGDETLKMTGELLARVFGGENCYRYGGDEFLVIIKEMSVGDRERKMKTLNDEAPFFENDGERIAIGYSVGCVEGVISTPTELRKLLNAADEKMYEMKNIKKAGR